MFWDYLINEEWIINSEFSLLSTKDEFFKIFELFISIESTIPEELVMFFEFVILVESVTLMLFLIWLEFIMFSDASTKVAFSQLIQSSRTSSPLSNYLLSMGIRSSLSNVYILLLFCLGCLKCGFSFVLKILLNLLICIAVLWGVLRWLLKILFWFMVDFLNFFAFFDFYLFFKSVILSFFNFICYLSVLSFCFILSNFLSFFISLLNFETSKVEFFKFF